MESYVIMDIWSSDHHYFLFIFSETRCDVFSKWEKDFYQHIRCRNIYYLHIESRLIENFKYVYQLISLRNLCRSIIWTQLSTRFLSLKSWLQLSKIYFSWIWIYFFPVHLKVLEENLQQKPLFENSYISDRSV